MAAYVTFIGGPDTGDVGSTTFEDTLHGFKVEFPLREPVLIDPENSRGSQNGTFLENIIKKASVNRYFTVEEATAKKVLKTIAPTFEHKASEPVDFDPEKEALVAEAESLGIDVDKRWSVRTLESKISEAKIKALD
jgi:hypothetical protein